MLERFLVAFDGGPSATKAVETIAGEPLLRGMACHVLMCGSDEGGARSRLDGAAERLREAGFDVQARIEPGHPEDVISANVERHAIDLLVMGAYGHSRIRNLIIGSTTTALIRSCKIPVLMFR